MKNIILALKYFKLICVIIWDILKRTRVFKYKAKKITIVDFYVLSSNGEKRGNPCRISLTENSFIPFRHTFEMKKKKSFKS